VISFVVFFLIFLLPFVIAPFGSSFFEIPKVIGAEILIIFLFLINSFRRTLFVQGKKTQIVLFGIVFLLTCIDLLFLRTSISFFGNAFRLQGIFLLLLLMGFSYLSATVQLKKVPWFYFFILIILQTIATLALPVNESNRSVGLLGEPNASAAVMLFLWPFLWFSLPKAKTRGLLILGISVLCIALVFYLTQSRSAMIGCALQLFLLLLVRIKFQLKAAVILCVCLLFATFSLPFFEKNVPYENRGEVWIAALYAGAMHPIVGGGFGNTEFLLHKEAQDHTLRIRKYYVDSAHNIFLDWWVQGGLLGLLVFCLLLFTSFHAFVRKNEIRNSILLLGLLAALSFNPASVVGLVQLWWILGLGLVGNNKLGD